jgi:hypothetical protein
MEHDHTVAALHSVGVGRTEILYPSSFYTGGMHLVAQQK